MKRLLLIERRRFPKIFFGWWIVLASGLLSIWSAGFHGYGFSALFKPIASELGFNRAATSVASSITRFEGGIEGPLSGWIVDRFGPRWVIVFGVFLLGLGLILMNFIRSLWAFYVVWGLVQGTGYNISMSIPMDKAISNWFVKKRGLAMSIRAMFNGLGGVLGLLLVAWLIITQGWRMTCVIGGLVMWFAGLPLAWFFIKQHRPEFYGLLPDGAAVEKKTAVVSRMVDRGVEYASEVGEIEFTLRQAFRTPAYWLLMTAGAAQGFAMTAILIHSVPFLTDIGFDPIKAAGMVAILNGVSIPARLVAGFLADRVKKSHLRFLIGGAYFMQALGLAVYLLNQTMPMIYVWFIVYGIGHGASIALTFPVRARYFGRKAVGSISGTTSMFTTPVGIVTPIYLGWIYDTTGSYITAFTLIAVLVTLAAVLVSFVLPPKPPAQITDIHKFL